jgi:hypothetical protein
MTNTEFGIYYFRNLIRLGKIIQALETGDHERGLKYARYAYEQAQKEPEDDWNFYHD